MAVKIKKPAKPAIQADTYTPWAVNELQQLLKFVDSRLDDCDSLMSVAAAALRHQDCDLDGACADVLEYSAFSALEHAREYLKKAVALLPAKNEQGVLS